MDDFHADEMYHKKEAGQERHPMMCVPARTAIANIGIKCVNKA